MRDISVMKGIFVILIFVINLFIATQVYASTDYVYKTYFGSQGSSNGNFTSPTKIAIDASGNKYIVDTGNNRIQKFDPSGNYNSEFGYYGSNSGAFAGPQGIAIDSSGYIYVVDSGNNRIQKFDPSGNYDSEFGLYGSGNGEFSNPQGIAIDSSGYVYVVDSEHYRIQKFNSSGVYESQFGVYGSNDGEFMNPIDIAIDSSGYIYVVDSGHHRIVQFDPSGNYNSQFGLYGSGNGEFFEPQGVAIDSSGYVYVADCGNNRIQKFTGGTYVAQISASCPTDLVVDAQGNLFIVENSNNRVVEFEPGPYLDQWGGFSAPQEIAYDYNGGFIYVFSDNAAGMVSKYDTNGSSMGYFAPQGSASNQIDTPKGIIVDSGGNVYVLDYNSSENVYSIKKFDASGNYITKWGSQGSSDGQFMLPTSIAIDGRDVIYVADTTRSDVQKFTTSGAFISRFNTFSGLQSIVIDRQGYIYMTDSSGYNIYKYESNGTLSTQFGSSGSGDGQFSAIGNISIDAEGNIYILDNGNYRVQKIDSSGSYITKFGSSGTENGEFASGPQGIVQDASGNTYVVDTGNNRIQKFRSTTQNLALIDATADQSFVYLKFAENIDAGTLSVNVSDFSIAINNASYPTLVSYDQPSPNVLRFSASDSFLSYGDSIVFSFNKTTTHIAGSVSGRVYTTVPQNTQHILVRNIIQPISIDQIGYSINQNQTAATLSWTTNYNSNAVIEYGVNDIGENSVNVSDAAQSNSHTLTGLNPNTVYRYRITATNVAGSNSVQTEEKTFMTNYLGTLSTNISSSRGVAVNSLGYIYVVDNDNNQVKKMNSKGVQVAQFGTYGTGNGQFANPSDIVIDSSDNVYVSDTGNHRIQKFDSLGNFISQIGTAGSGDGEFSSPKGLSVVGGYLYVVDTGNNRIQKFNSSGSTVVAQFGTYGTGNGQFANPSDIVIDSSDNVYVSDTGNHRIQKFDSSGNYDSQFGTNGTGNGEFSSPGSLVFNPYSMNLYVADVGNHRIQQFDMSGDYVLQFGASTEYGGQIHTMQGLAFGPELTSGVVGDLFVSDSGTSSVLRFGVDTMQPTLQSAQIEGNTLEMVFDEILESNSPSIGNLAIAINGSIVQTINTITVSGSKVIVSLNTLVTPSDNVTITYTQGGTNIQDVRGNAIQTGAINSYAVTNTTLNLYYISTIGTAGSANGELNVPAGITIDQTSNLYVADSGNNRIQKFNSSGVYQLQFGSPGAGDGEIYQPLNVAINGSGDLYVSDVGNNRVQRFDSAGVYQSQFGSGEFTGLRKITINGSEIYVTDTVNNRIQIYNEFGVLLREIGSSGSGVGQFNTPSALVFDSQNDIYVLDAGNNRVQKFNHLGSGLYAYGTEWGTSGSENGQFSSPIDMYIDQSDNIYVIDAGNNRLQKFNTSGVYKGKWIYDTAGDTYIQSAKGIAIDGNGYLYISDESQGIVKKLSFTVPADVTAPTISNIATSTVSNTSITITWTTDENASSTVTYGLTSSYTNTITSDNLVTNHSTTLIGLTPGATYHFRVLTSDASANTSSSSDNTFTMPDTTSPVLSSIASSTTQTTATITWTTNESATTTVNYGLTSSYGTASSSVISTTTHRTVITGLTPDTTYHFRISSWDTVGNLATSTDLILTTLDATTLAPTLAAPITGTYTNTSPMSISFRLPEVALSNSISLTFTPSVGTPIVLNLRDVTPNATNTFSLPLTSGITTTVTEVLSATADSIPTGTYTVTLSYRDALGNSAASVSTIGVVISNPAPTPPSRSSSYDESSGSSGSWLPTPVVKSTSTIPVIVVSTSTVATSTARVYKFAKDLILHNIHPDILQLQKFLNKKGFIVAKTGPGSVGKETAKFGSATKAALIKFQRAHKIPGTGFFGPVTRGVVNNMKW